MAIHGIVCQTNNNGKGSTRPKYNESRERLVMGRLWVDAVCFLPSMYVLNISDLV